MSDLIIPADILQKADINPEELLIDLAVYLYDKERLSIGQARRLAGLDLISFQHAMAKRDVFLHYDVEDLLADLKNLGLAK